MKKNLLAISVALLSLNSFANTVVLTNDEGCYVEQEQTNNGTMVYVQVDGNTQILGFGNDYSFGDFTYCSDESLNVTYFEGPYGTEVRLSCSANDNGQYRTRGRATMSFNQNGLLQDVNIEGQVKRFFGWKEEEMIVCKNLTAE